MQDRGDTVIHLARKILNEGVEDHRSIALRYSLQTTPLTWRTLCLSTCLAAMGASAATAWHYEQIRPANKYERTEINALIFYAARLNGIDEASLRHEMQAARGISSFDDMTAKDFIAIRDELRARAQKK